MYAFDSMQPCREEGIEPSAEAAACAVVVQDAEEQHLWMRWRSDNEEAARDALVMQYSPWARLMARDIYMRVHLMSDTWRDCAQNAMIGMLDAMARFDPSLGIKFTSYARSRVRGAVFDGLRDLTESHRQARAREVLEDRVESLADDTEGEDLLESFVSMTVGLGLGFLMDAQSIPAEIEAALSHYQESERDGLLSDIGQQLDKLKERERTILVLHYYHQLPFVDIAEQLKLTKGRVSQLHKRALEQLRILLRPPSSQAL
ncbi:sigma-70 family RNA polymerase sigma factor [Dyella sp.]|uniref:sigma-70 family RNA polymerase sigma factor n=1 Tax=Dyella sp. TaxID=1869338 RepID=UPI002ED01E34